MLFMVVLTVQKFLLRRQRIQRIPRAKFHEEGNMSRTKIYENCRAEGQSRAHFGDNHYNYSSTTEEELIELILNWLSPQDHSDRRNVALRSYQPDTLRWFFDDTTFKSWVDVDLDANHAASTRILWCQGDMGTGKSILATKVAEKLLEDPYSENHIALVFCSWNQRNEQTSEALLGSLLAQLYRADIPGEVRESYRRSNRHGQKMDPSRAELESWLKRFLISAQRPPVLILDGVDELQPTVRSDIIHFLQSSALARVKILVTSRFAPDGAEVRGQVSLVDFCSKDSDIERFIAATFNSPSARKFKRLINSKRKWADRHQMTEDYVVSTILAKCSGM